jgi:hypothetical protein
LDAKRWLNFSEDQKMVSLVPPGTAQLTSRSSPKTEGRQAMHMNRFCCFLVASAVGIGAPAAYAALPEAHPGPTVNDYTATESGRAKAAARAAGFDKLEITMVQAGNFFLNAEKAGQTYFLTVTPEDKVYPSAPSPANTG